MKKSPSFFRLLLMSLLALIQNFSLNAQTVTKTTSSVVSGTVCPVAITEYSVSILAGFSNCSRLWTATNGTIDGSATGATVKVKWNDTPGTNGRITCTFSNCGNSNDNTAPYLEELIVSIKDQAWGTYGNTVDIDFCTKAQVNLIVPRMFVQGTGGLTKIKEIEVAYAWTLPDGWREVGTNNMGFFGTTTNYISIEP